MTKTLIFGHQKPDTDSVTSAIALAYLKNKLGKNCEPRVLGNINNETAFALDYFKEETPKYLNDVKLQIKDTEYLKDIYLNESDSIFKAYDYMKTTNIGLIPVVTKEKKLIGALSMKDVAGSLIFKSVTSINTSYDNLLEALNAKEILRFDKEIKGNIIAPSYRSETFKEKVEIDRESVLIVGDRYKILEYAVKNCASIIILTNGVKMNDELLEIAKKNNVDVISTEYDGITTANLVILSNYAKDNMTKEKIISVNENDALSDVLDMASKKKFSNYPIINNNGEYLGIFRVSMADKRTPKKVILVDHNEKEQSVTGLDEAEIIEIVDHHKIGNIGTSLPINFRNMPLGSTNTIIYLLFKENNIEIPKNIAGLMMSGIISDTLLLTSPTTTNVDKEVLEELSKIAEVDMQKYGMELFKAGSSMEGKSINDIIFIDFKNFSIDSRKVGIGQVSTMTTDEIMKKQDEFVNELNIIAENQGYSAVALFVTDILKNGSYILFNKNAKEIFTKSFGLDTIYQGYFFEGLVSRKKQVVPKIVNHLENI